MIAVGDEATQVEMNKITRSTDRYLKVKSATDLLNKDFIQQITGDTCAKGIKHFAVSLLILDMRKSRLRHFSYRKYPKHKNSNPE